jgi:ATP-dependent DNA ligase
MSRVRFIPPALATLRSAPPAGKQWQYEVKFDGFPTQLHNVGQVATLLHGRHVPVCVYAFDLMQLP